MNKFNSKLILALLVFLLGIIFFPKNLVSYSFAHGSEVPKFFTVSGETPEKYPLDDIGVFSSKLSIPQDYSEKKFLVNQEIKFEISKEKLETVFEKDDLKYQWDFGDGVKSDLEKINHIYKKTGSYIVTVTAGSKKSSEAEKISETVLINVIPNKDYKLPNPVIKVNNETSNKKDYNTLDLNFNNNLSFDGSGSKAGSSKIVKYVWDFGDENSTVGINISHEYELPQAFATVVLRVYDEKGLFSDTFVNLRNSGSNEPKSKIQNLFSTNKVILIVFVLILLIGGFIFLKKKK